MVNKSLGVVYLAEAVMEIGKKTTLVLFLKYSTLIWKECPSTVLE